MRPSRDTILNEFRACAEKLGRVPGQEIFRKMSYIRAADVFYYWPTHSALVKEAGLEPNVFAGAIPEDELFKSYAEICLHLGKIPSTNELRIASRELRLNSHNAYTNRYPSVKVMRNRFREWLLNGPSEYRSILEFGGWPVSSVEDAEASPKNTKQGELSPFQPFLPVALQCLDQLSRGEKPSVSFEGSVNTAFERRCADAFTCLGFEVENLGQGKGRKADCLAIARQDGFAVIIDAKVRSDGYVLGTEDRKFLEYAATHSRELQSAGLQKVYFAVIGSEFRESDLTKLTMYLAQSPIRSVDFITAKALMNLVERSIRERHRFRLSEVDQILFGNKIIAV